jgi:hypothetical protein
MKASNLRKGLRVKVKQDHWSKAYRGKYGTVVSDVLTECGQVLIKIDGYDGHYDGNVKLKPTSVKLSDEKPEVGDRIVVLSKPTKFFDVGATGIVRGVGDKGLLVNFDGGVYLRSGNVDSWYAGNNRKVGIIKGGAK